MKMTAIILSVLGAAGAGLAYVSVREWKLCTDPEDFPEDLRLRNLPWSAPK